MEDGLRESSGDVVVYLDGDLRGLDPQLIRLMVAPIAGGEADFVKARFSREAGRVTVLTAKPLLATFFPELAGFAQPLGGIIAARRDLLLKLKFETDYGVDLGLLIDARFAGAKIREVDIGHLEHDRQSLDALGEMAKQVVRVLMHRAHEHGRLSIQQVREVEEVERHASGSITAITSKAGQVQQLALFDMDGTLLQGRSILAVAEQAGCTRELAPLLDDARMPPDERTRAIARILTGIPQQLFIEVARNLPLNPGAAETVVELRRLGFRVGIVSDAFRIVAEIVRRRVFADFSVANMLRFQDGIATGEVTPARIFRHPRGCPDHEVCKWNAMMHIERRFDVPASRILTVGDSLGDFCMLKRAGRSVAYEPKSAELSAVAAMTIHGDLRQLLPLTAC